MGVERYDMGIIRHPSEVFKESHEGQPLTVWLPEAKDPKVLVLASLHGDESKTTVVLSDALRPIRAESLRNAAILCANPGELVRGTRGNANDVDLNLITYEFEAASAYDLKERHSPVLIDVLTGMIDPEEC